MSVGFLGCHCRNTLTGRGIDLPGVYYFHGGAPKHCFRVRLISRERPPADEVGGVAVAIAKEVEPCRFVLPDGFDKVPVSDKFD